jgi:hypothetical protein
MTLSEKLVKALRAAKDSGLSIDHFASMFADVTPAKIKMALTALEEQERVILGNDGCWYLGDSELPGAGAALASAGESAPIEADSADGFSAGTVKVYAGAPPTSPDDEPKGPLLMEYIPPPGAKAVKVKPDDSVARTEKPKPLMRWIKAPPVSAKTKLRRWLDTRSDFAPPIPWGQLCSDLDVKKTTLGKARASLVSAGETALIEKLDRLVYRQDSRSIQERHEKGNYTMNQPALAVGNDIQELADRLKAAAPPPNWKEHRATLLELDRLLGESLGWPEDRPTRTALREVGDWLEKAGKDAA